MGQRASKCKFCVSEHRAVYERAAWLKEMSLSAIGEKLEMHKQAVWRHMREHAVPLENIEVLTEKQEIMATEGTVTAYDKLLNRLDDLQGLADDLYNDPSIPKLKKVSVVLSVWAESRKTFETMGKLFEIQVEQKKMQGTLNRLNVTVEVVCPECKTKNSEFGMRNSELPTASTPSAGQASILKEGNFVSPVLHGVADGT